MNYDVKVVAGQLVLLSEALLPAVKKDVLNSLLLIQLYADSSADKFSQFQAWGRSQVEAQVNTQWVNTYTKSSDHEMSREVEFTVTALVTDYLPQILSHESRMPADAVATALNAVMRSATAKKSFVEEVLKTNPVQSAQAPDSTSTIIVQLCVVESKASMFCVDVNLLVDSILGGDLFVHPVKGENVIGKVDISVSQLELDLVEYGNVRKRVLAMIGVLNNNRKAALNIIDVLVPPPEVVEHSGLLGL